MQLSLLLAITIAVLFIESSLAQPQNLGLYVKDYGRIGSTPILYVHGGPGFSSWDFELTTAPVLASLGYFVIVYDERGQGRSEPCNASEYNYRVYAEDIKAILDL